MAFNPQAARIACGDEDLGDMGRETYPYWVLRVDDRCAFARLGDGLGLAFTD